ncbi:MAG: YhbY family RNA-binding protein [Acidobacteria bacterium]|nr:MAG: YhbY family RNA-binding protein [Acidobacteriota bacterium]
MTPRFTSRGRERRSIRAALHGERPAVRIGKAGATEAVLASVREALSAREAIKLAVGKGYAGSVRELAVEVAQRAGAELVAVTGRTFILFRPEEEAEPDPEGTENLR